MSKAKESAKSNTTKKVASKPEEGKTVKSVKKVATIKKTAETKPEEAKASVVKKTVAAKKEATVKSSATVGKVAAKKVPVKKSQASVVGASVTFEIRFSTEFGQTMYVVGNHAQLGNDDLEKAVPMHYLNDKAWNITVEFDADALTDNISYYYFVKNADGSIVKEGIPNKTLSLSTAKGKKIYVSDFWSFAGFPVGLFETKPFQVLLPQTPDTKKKAKKSTHVFTVKAPAIAAGQCVCLLGDDKQLGAWEMKKSILLERVGEGNWQVALDLSKATFPVHYKFGIWDTAKNTFIQLEDYENRYCAVSAAKEDQVYVNDGLIKLSSNA